MEPEKRNIDLKVEPCDGYTVFRLVVTGNAENQEWAELFEKILIENRDSSDFRFLVDSRFGNDLIDIEGFKMLGNLFQKYEVEHCMICVLTRDTGFDILKDLFLDVMEKMGFQFKCKVYFNEKEALDWLTQK